MCMDVEGENRASEESRGWGDGWTGYAPSGSLALPSLPDHAFLSFRPSQVAAACIALCWRPALSLLVVVVRFGRGWA